MVQMGHLDQEELRTVLLETKNSVQDIVTVYRGSLNASMIRVGEVYKAAIKRNGAAIIKAHDHPSGEPEPSPEDVLVTVQIAEAGTILDIQCLDHIVIGQGKWVSLRERGLGLNKITSCFTCTEILAH
jgi:DNA repair protein RadC